MLDKTQASVLHVPAGELYDALKRVRHAISREETRYYLGGAFLHLVDGKGPAKLCATDGHHMAVVTLGSSTFDGAAFPGVIIPATSVADILKCGIAKRARQLHDVPMEIAPSLVKLHPYDCPSIEFAPVDGTFPDYLRVIPRGETQTVTVNREELIKAVSAVYGFTQGATAKSGHAIKFDFTGQELKVSIDALNDGKAWYTIQTVDPVKHPIQIGFNGGYVLDIIESLEGGRVTFKLTDAGSPTIFAGDENTDGHALHVLMPMRV